MENGFTNLPKKVIVDTNILIEAAFNINGYSRNSLVLLNLMGFQLSISDKIYEEASKKLRDNRKNLKLDYNPKLFLDHLIQNFDMELFPCNSKKEFKFINKKDQIVARASVKKDGFVLTNDLKLYDECIQESIPVRFSWQVDAEYKMLTNKTDIRYLNIHPPAKEKGYIFARIIPSGWDSDSKLDKEFTILDIKNIGRLFYKSKENIWSFNTISGIAANIEFEFQRNEILTFLVNYDVDNELLELRSSHHSHPTHEKLKSFPIRKSVGRITFGHDVNNENYLNGYLRAIVIGHKKVSKKKFRLLCEYDEALPNPWDVDMLKLYMKKSFVKRTEHGFELAYFKTSHSVK